MLAVSVQRLVFSRQHVTLPGSSDITGVMTSMPAQRTARFAAIYREHLPAVAAYVRRRASDDVTEDVVHETFLVAWRRFDDLPHDPLPWLYGIARRTLANDRRGDARRLALVDRIASASGPLGEDDAPLPNEELPPRLREALLGLPPLALEALLLTAWEELSPARAAKALGCSAVTFRARLHRARQRLTPMVEQRPGGRPARSEPPQTSLMSAHVSRPERST